MLDESVNLHEALTKGDKKTIDAFYNKKEDDSSSMVNSTGTVLKKVGFGGAQDIAKWEGNKVKITATMDDRQTQEVVRYIKKTFPRNQLLDESVNLHEALTKGDKKTIDAFYNKKEDDSSSMVNSTGTVLKKVGFAGAQDIAKWEGNKVKITATMDDRQTQEVVRYIKKTFPRNVIQ
jgi:viroplasmin and RNaseH domain-containing protein